MTYKPKVLEVAAGGTGDATLTNHGVLIGQGTSAVAATAAGTALQVLQSGGASADPAYSTATYPATNTAGDLMYSSGTNVYANLAVGTFPGIPLITDSAAPKWYNPAVDFFLLDDFMSGSPGNTNYLANNQNAASAGQTSALNHPGVVILNTNANTNGAVGISRQGLFTTDGRILLQFLMLIPTLSDGTDTYIIRVGLGTGGAATGDFTDGAYFQYTHSVNSGAWTIKTSNNSTQTTANTASTVDTNWHLYKIDMNAAGTSVAFYIDGVQVTNSPIATNLPGNTRLFGDSYRITKSAGANSRSLNLDLTMIWKQITSARF